MTTYVLGPNQQICVIPPDSNSDSDDVLKNETILVLLEKLHVGRLFSKDRIESSREGTLAISLGNQATSLSWSRPKNTDAPVKNGDKFHHYVLFLGKPDVNLDLSVNVVETDTDTVKGLRRANAALSGASAIANLVPGPGTAVSVGLNMLGAILDFIKGQVDDDTELSLHASMTQESPSTTDRIQLKKGTYKVIRKAENPSDQSDPDIEVHIGVYNFKPLSPDQVKEVVVVLDSITLDLPDSNSKYPNLEQRTLVFDATVGGGENASKFAFRDKILNGKASIDKVIGIKDKVLYQGPWNVGVPFTFSLAAVRDSNELKAIDGLIETAGVQAKRFAKEKKVEDTIKNATKAIQSIRSLMVEFLPHKFSIGTKSGLIVDENSIIDSDLRPTTNGAACKLYLLSDLSEEEWKKVIIVLQNETSPASAKVTLKIKLQKAVTNGTT